MPRKDSPISKKDQEKMSLTRLEAQDSISKFSEKSLKGLGSLERIAWLQGADRPLSEIHVASSLAIKKGHTWKEVANARGMGHTHNSARVAATAHNTWYKRNNLERDI